MIARAALALVLLAGFASADPARHAWNGSPEAWVEVHAPTAPGAVASVTFHNELIPVHRNASSGTVWVQIDGLRVAIEWAFGAGATPDTIIVTPPEGYVSAPRHLTVEEGESGTAHIYPNGVGS